MTLDRSTNGDAREPSPADENQVPASDVIQSARLAIDEIRRQIEMQAQSASALDTKGAAVLTLTGTVAGLVASRVHLDSPLRVELGVALLGIVLAILLACIQAVRPRGGFSYGADASSLATLVDRYPHWQVVLAMVDSLRDARVVNVEHLAAKGSWYSTSLRLVVVGVMVLAVLVAIEGVR
jgi:hypothetical protein